MNRRQIPVWLLTGFLGSGKTSLLLNWLKTDVLSNAAVVINEVGDVGLDNTLLSNVVDSASVLLGHCVCCSGLEGLEATLSDLWWDRLYRKRPQFDAVIIETTGLADPRSIQAAFKQHPFLRARYQLRATLTTVSACNGMEVLNTFNESVSQVKSADVVVLTHVDTHDAASLVLRVKSINPHAVCLSSSNASLSWQAVMSATPIFDAHHTSGAVADCFQDPQESHQHQHSARVKFVATSPFPDAQHLTAFVATHVQANSIRLKGIVSLRDGRMYVVHWVMQDKQASIVLYTGTAPKDFGLTCIVTQADQFKDAPRAGVRHTH